MSKITDAIAKTMRSAVVEPTSIQETIIRSRGRGTSRKARSILPISPAQIETNSEILYTNRVVTTESKREVISSYKMLRTRLLRAMRSNKWQVLAVTSPVSGDGKTLTAVNLAIMIAKEGGQNVFLIDLDLRNPSINRCLGIDDDKRSISRFYAEDRELSELLIAIEQNGLFIIGNSGSGIENSSELISSQRSEALLSELKSLDPSGIFIFDLPPVLSTDDVLAFAPLLDAALVVVSEGKTIREHIIKTLDLLNESKVEIAGVVLNRAGEENVDAYY